MEFQELTDIKEALTNAGKRSQIELAYKLESIDKTYYHIGFESHKFIWSWLRVEFTGEKLSYIFFDHSYSQITGATHRGIIRGIKVIDNFKRITGIKF